MARNPMQGRHATGQQPINPGKTRGGQAEPAGNKVKTASTPRMKPRPPVLTDQAKTSEGLQRLIPPPPMPFENPKGSVNVLAPVNREAAHPYGKAAQTLLPKKAGARMEKQLNCGDTRTTNDMLAAVGETRNPGGYTPLTSGFRVGKGKR